MIEYPQLGFEVSDNAMAVLDERYFLRDEEGKIIEKPQDMFKRVAKKIASKEKNAALRKKWAKKYYDIMASGLFMPNSPTLMNAGRGNNSVFSGCFVIPLEDKISGGKDSLYGVMEVLAKIHKMGGGTGCSFRKVRGIDAVVSSTGHMASGPVSFMGVHNEGIECIMQGGMRRGAHINTKPVWHVDIELFINSKNELNVKMKRILNKIEVSLNLDKDGQFLKTFSKSLIEEQLNNMNNSVGITKEFKDALFEDGKYDIICPSRGFMRKEKASKIFDLMAYNAWLSGEPGIIDLHRMNENNPVAHLGDIHTTNPCGEVPLLDWESCNLGSIAISRILKKKGDKYVINYKKLKDIIITAVRFLDSVIDTQMYPFKEIEKATKKTRKIGLGLMGFADSLIKLQLVYGSKKCVDFVDTFMDTFDSYAKKVSIKLAKEKGNFPGYKGSQYEKDGVPMRNATRLTIAPTGSIAGIAGVSFGIEPIFAAIYERTILGGKKFIEVATPVKEMLQDRGEWNEQTPLDLFEGRKKLPDDLKKLIVTAHEVTPKQHVEMQAAFQRHIDNAVSKTVNLPSDATVEDVKNIFKLAFKLGCKGITVYRDGSRGGQVLSTKRSGQTSLRKVRNRPRILTGKTYERNIGDCGKLFVTINTDKDGYPFEIFVEAGKAGGCLSSQMQAIGRLISLAWRCNLGVEGIIKQLRGITCHKAKPSLDKEGTFLSCSDAVVRVIEECFLDKIEEKIPEEGLREAVCPDCGGPMKYEGRCGTCLSCIKSKCN